MTNSSTSTSVARSEKIAILSFMLAVLIVMGHSLLPASHGMPHYFATVNSLLGTGRSAVPVFFFITSYLFFRNFSIDKLGRKLHSRLRSLVVPYLLWNILSAILWFAFIAVFGREYMSDNIRFDSLWQIAGDILASKYSILWFVGVIIVYAVLSPLIYYMVRGRCVGIVMIIVSAIVAVVFRHPFSSPLLWLPVYLGGAWTGLHYPDFMYRRMPVALTIAGIVFFPVFTFLDISQTNNLWMNLVHWTAPLFFIGIYDVLDSIFNFAVHRAYKYSFFIYSLHYIPIHFLQHYIVLNDSSAWACWMAVTVVPTSILLLIIVIACLTERFFPRVYSCFSGGR